MRNTYSRSATLTQATIAAGGNYLRQTNGSAERCVLRWGAQAEARRLALCVLWGRYPEAEAEREMRSTLALSAARGKFSVPTGRLASEILDEAIEALLDAYEPILADVEAAVLAGLRRQLPRVEVEMTAARVALAADPQPPPHLVAEAISRTFGFFIRSERSWAKYELEAAA